MQKRFSLRSNIFKWNVDTCLKPDLVSVSQTFGIIQELRICVVDVEMKRSDFNIDR